MVVLLFVLTIVAFVTADYFIQKKKKIGFAGEPEPVPIPISQVMNLIPKGVFLQPSLTWSKIQDNGSLKIGLNPIVLGLIGDMDEIELQGQDKAVKKGEPLLKIRKGEKLLHIQSPVAGKILQLNQPALHGTNWKNVSQSWLYTVEPENLAQEVSNWFIAEKAQNWLNQKYAQIKEFFMQSLPTEQLGVTMADGGDIPVGILSQFEQETWQKFEEKITH